MGEGGFLEALFASFIGLEGTMRKEPHPCMFPYAESGLSYILRL
jgi:hypothetical protein